MTLFDSGIRPAIDDHLLALSKEKRDYGDYWSASSAGYCQRKVMFERLGVPYVETEADARKQRIFTSGHLFHAWMQGITKEAGLSIASEVELQDEDLMVRGHFDDLVLVNDNLILYDYKTVNSQSFKYKKDTMSYFHRLQLGTYMYMLKDIFNKLDESMTELYPITKMSWKGGKPELNESRILYISKDDLRMAELQLFWDAELEKDVLDYWNSLNVHWKARTWPECTCADHENGFMAKEKWNPYFYDGEPCSMKWYLKFKENSNVRQEVA